MGQFKKEHDTKIRDYKKKQMMQLGYALLTSFKNLEIFGGSNCICKINESIFDDSTKQFGNDGMVHFEWNKDIKEAIKDARETVKITLDIAWEFHGKVCMVLSL